MIVKPHVTFCFAFTGITSKSKARVRLTKFLHDKDWLPAESDQDPLLLNYHTNGDGSCEVILNETEELSIEECADLFFMNLRRTNDIEYIKIFYNEYAEKLICNKSGMYHNYQTVDFLELKENDPVVIYHK